MKRREFNNLMIYRYTLYLIPVQIKIAKGEIVVPFRQGDKNKYFDNFL